LNTKATIGGSPQGAPPPGTRKSVADIPLRLRIAGIFLRAVFIAILLALTVRVSSPQIESIWSAYETPGDLIRLALGLAVFLWILFHLFMPPKDAEAYRTWLYLGLIVAPFVLVVAIAVW
jgi:hypothetical protein